jgi:hypothetical protein
MAAPGHIPTRSELAMPKITKTPFNGNRRQKHHHWQVTIFYGGGEEFARTYKDEDRARKFAKRQEKSPVVLRALVRRID